MDMRDLGFVIIHANAIPIYHFVNGQEFRGCNSTRTYHVIKEASSYILIDHMSGDSNQILEYDDIKTYMGVPL
jgi:hypothetical protein